MLEDANAGLAALLRARRGDQRAGYLFGEDSTTWEEIVRESGVRASCSVS